MSLADRLAAARESRGDAALPADDTPAEVVSAGSHTGSAPASPAAATESSGGGKRRADTGATASAATPAPAPRATASVPEPTPTRTRASAAQSDRMEEVKSSVHVQLLQQM